MAKAIKGDRPSVRQTKCANRFDVDFVENDAYYETEETLGDEIGRFDLDRVQDFDGICDYDGYSPKGEFVPISRIFAKFWSDPVICRKYPNLSAVANHVSQFEITSVKVD